jgi:biotin carboxylase
MSGTPAPRLGAIVDGYSTGSHLAPRFAVLGAPCVHVESAPPTPFYARSFRPADYVAHLAHRGDLGRTLVELRELDVAFVVAGAEPGVPLADALSEGLGLPSNGTALSAARRDKHAMGEALRRAGVPAVEQLRTAEVEEAIAWARARDDWPVVVKPIDSAGTDGVVFCASAEELRDAFATQLGHPNALGGANGELLVQEQLRGTQFFVNSISWDGVHAITEVWRDTRRRVEGAGMVCDREQLLPRHGPEQDVVVPYVERVLDALGIRFGPGHAEVMLTARGPVLIECAARMQGSMLPDAVERCTPSHVAVTVEAYLDPASVARRAARPYELRAHAECIALISEQEGLIRSCERLRELRRLPSYHSEIAMLGVGDRIARTVDLFSSPGSVYLVHIEERRLRQEYERLRAIERAGLFEVEPLLVAEPSSKHPALS